MNISNNPDDVTHAYDLKTAYFAGIIDGEGHVYLKFKALPSGDLTPQVGIQVAMTDEPTIRAIMNHFGVGSFITQKKRPNRKIAYRWSVSHNKARGVVEMILPYSITKKEILRSILATPPAPRGGDPLNIKRGERSPAAKFTQEFVDAFRLKHKAACEFQRSLGFRKLPRDWFTQTSTENGVPPKLLYEIVLYGYGLPSKRAVRKLRKTNQN